MVQYRQRLDEQQRRLQQETANLQQQRRMAQYRFQEQYLERLREQNQTFPAPLCERRPGHPNPSLPRGDSAVNRSILCRLLAVWLLVPLSSGVVAADNWPQWRGPTDDGISKETNLPTEWSETKNVAWKLPLPGMGGSTPVVWGDRIFLTSEDGKDLVLLCVSTDGKELWKTARSAPASAATSEATRATTPRRRPSTDGKHVYAFVGTGDLACFDFDGKEVWKFNAQERYGKFKHRARHAHHAAARRRPALPAADPLPTAALVRRPRQGHRQGGLEGRAQERRPRRVRALLRLARACGRRARTPT